MEGSTNCHFLCLQTLTWDDQWLLYTRTTSHSHRPLPLYNIENSLSHWAHFTVFRFIFVYVLFCDWLYIACMCSIVTRWGGPGGMEAWFLGPLLPSVLWHCWLGHLIWPVKPAPDMTYNVYSGTLNPTQWTVTEAHVVSMCNAITTAVNLEFWKGELNQTTLA